MAMLRPTTVTFGFLAYDCLECKNKWPPILNPKIGLQFWAENFYFYVLCTFWHQLSSLPYAYFSLALLYLASRFLKINVSYICVSALRCPPAQNEVFGVGESLESSQHWCSDLMPTRIHLVLHSFFLASRGKMENIQADNRMLKLSLREK
jgi:hypothetical protein